MRNTVYQDWTDRWQQTIGAIRKATGADDCRFELKPPATLAEVKAVEHTLGCRLPESFREVLCNFSSELQFFWFLRDHSFPGPLDFIGWGICDWDLAKLPALETGRQRWLELGDGPDSPWGINYDKLYIATVGNGDSIAIDLSQGPDGEVVYLACHFDDEPGHGYRLGVNFIDFIDRWTRIGCVGPEIWQLMEFTNGPETYIDPDSELAMEWQKVLDL